MFDINVLREVILDQQALYVARRYVPRHQFEKVLDFASNPQVIILKGVRRCGKSTLMQQVRQIQNDKDYFLSFEDERLISFAVEDFQMLLEVLIELFGIQKTFYFDEIQNVIGWERFIRRLHDQGNKIYITGSNANLLSRELGTHLTGRYISIELYPYSFYEYNLAQKNPIDESLKTLTTAKRSIRKRWLNEYQQAGGFPEYLENQKVEYLSMLYESILYRDIISRYRIPNEKPIKELVFYLASNIGKTTSYNNLSKTIGVSSGATVAEYGNYLENSYLFFFIHRYDFSLKKQIQSPKKCYIIDTALAHILGFRTSSDTGRFLENLVFIELKRRNWGSIYYHQGKNECDFLIRQGNSITHAMQVTQSLKDPDTEKREYAGLIEAMQTYHLTSGLILTENETGEKEILMGEKTVIIKIQPIWEWLLKV